MERLLTSWPPCLLVGAPSTPLKRGSPCRGGRRWLEIPGHGRVPMCRAHVSEVEALGLADHARRYYPRGLVEYQEAAERFTAVLAEQAAEVTSGH